MNKIYVLTKRPGEAPRHVWVSDTHENLLRYVGAELLECVPIASDLCILCDQKARATGKPLNVTVCGLPIMGDLIICGYTGKKDRKYTDLPCDWKRLKQLYPQLWIKPERLEKGVSK